jgi:hypothetical protein
MTRMSLSSKNSAAPVARAGGFLLVVGIVLGAIVSGVVATAVSSFTRDLVWLGLAWLRNRSTFSLETYANEYGFFSGPEILVVLFFIPFCMVLGSLFLAINRQSGFLKYVSGALTGGTCLCVAVTLLGLVMPASDDPMTLKDFVFDGCVELVSGALGAIAFLAIVERFDVSGRLFKRPTNKFETTITLTNSGAPQP